MKILSIKFSLIKLDLSSNCRIFRFYIRLIEADISEKLLILTSYFNIFVFFAHDRYALRLI